MKKKILVVTKKPFAAEAVNKIEEIVKKNGYEFLIMENYRGQDNFENAIYNVDALIVRSDKVTREILQSAKNLQIVVRAGAGYDNVDLKTATEKNIVVMNTPGQNSNAVAELAFGMMLFKSRGFFNGKAGSELKNKKIGIHAYGNVGRCIAKMAKGFSMEVYAFDPFLEKKDIEKDGVKVLDSAEELYKTCQYISLNIPSNKNTKKSINIDLLKSMPENAVLVNTARKEVICEKSLLQIFKDRKDFSYISDLAPDCKDAIIENYENRYFFTPKKMGAQTKEANINAGIASANQIVNFFKKGDITFKVN